MNVSERKGCFVKYERGKRKGRSGNCFKITKHEAGVPAVLSHPKHATCHKNGMRYRLDDGRDVLARAKHGPRYN